nr:fatty acid desaturase [Natronocella acetinitrilica]
MWAMSLGVLLTADQALVWWAPLAVLMQTFLYTGLFITAHDAMHGTVAPAFPRLNRFIGATCVRLYALFSFQRLQQAHWAHHQHPATTKDPDFHDGEHDGLVRWYLHFMIGYVSPLQIVGMAAIFNVFLFAAGVPVANLILFWILPSLLSTLQLFYFGTVLPHREPRNGYNDSHRARSNDFSPLVSFLTCYHFGYHWEHHERPDLPWWRLPHFRRRTTGCFEVTQ